MGWSKTKIGRKLYSPPSSASQSYCPKLSLARCDRVWLCQKTADLAVRAYARRSSPSHAPDSNSAVMPSTVAWFHQVVGSRGSNPTVPAMFTFADGGTAKAESRLVREGAYFALMEYEVLLVAKRCRERRMVRCPTRHRPTRTRETTPIGVDLCAALERE